MPSQPVQFYRGHLDQSVEEEKASKQLIVEALYLGIENLQLNRINPQEEETKTQECPTPLKDKSKVGVDFWHNFR